jgi:hypothetical protein
MINNTNICIKKLTAKYFKVFLKLFFLVVDGGGWIPPVVPGASQSAQSSGAG